MSQERFAAAAVAGVSMNVESTIGFPVAAAGNELTVHR
jgi:hypothetical protein